MCAGGGGEEKIREKFNVLGSLTLLKFFLLPPKSGCDSNFTQPRIDESLAVIHLEDEETSQSHYHFLYVKKALENFQRTPSRKTRTQPPLP